MAALARRTWAQLLTELEARVARNTTAFIARAKYVMASVFYDLALTYHHPELDTFDQTLVCSISNPYVTLPTTVYIPISVIIRNPTTNAIVASLQPSATTFSFSAYTAAAGQPTKYTRFGTRLWFDKLPDLAYKIDLLYYTIPAAPDFDGTDSPMTGQLWDEHILDGSVARCQEILWRPELAAPNAQHLQGFLARTVQRPLIELPLPEVPIVGNLGRQIGGPQG